MRRNPRYPSLAKLCSCSLSPRTEEASCLCSSWQAPGLQELRMQAWIPGALWTPSPEQTLRPPFQLCCLRAESHTHESSRFAGMAVQGG